MPYEEADMEVCTKYYFLKEHVRKQGTEVASNAEVDVESGRDYVLFAREMCHDLIKKMFLACWNKLELPVVNVDSLLQDIHLLWNDIVEFQVKRLDNAESKADPHAILIDDILLEEKFRDGVLVFMNDSKDKKGDSKRKCKEVSGLFWLMNKTPKGALKTLANNY